LRTPGHGGAEAAATYRGIIDGSITKDPIPTEVVTLTGALYSFLKTSSMMAYLVMMIPRLVEFQRVIAVYVWFFRGIPLLVFYINTKRVTPEGITP